MGDEESQIGQNLVNGQQSQFVQRRSLGQQVLSGESEVRVGNGTSGGRGNVVDQTTGEEFLVVFNVADEDENRAVFTVVLLVQVVGLDIEYI